MYMQFPALPLLVPFWTEVYGKGLGRASTVVLWDHIFVLPKLRKSICSGSRTDIYRELSTASRIAKTRFWPLFEQLNIFMSFFACL